MRSVRSILNDQSQKYMILRGCIYDLLLHVMSILSMHLTFWSTKWACLGFHSGILTNNNLFIYMHNIHVHLFLARSSTVLVCFILCFCCFVFVSVWFGFCVDLRSFLPDLLHAMLSASDKNFVRNFYFISIVRW